MRGHKEELDPFKIIKQRIYEVFSILRKSCTGLVVTHWPCCDNLVVFLLFGFNFFAVLFICLVYMYMPHLDDFSINELN